MATDAVRRNDPCPCGSGDKYKKCCMGAGGERRRKQLKMAKIAAAVAVVLGLLCAVAFDRMTGLLVGVGGLALVAMYVLFTDPPPPRKGGDPGAINFGG